MEMHPGQWLWEEGMENYHGMDFKKVDKERGLLMMEASASFGFPMAVAHCYLNGWNGLKWDNKIAFDMFVKIEKETNGYHWAQYMLGGCYEFGYAQFVDENDKKRIEYYSLSAEQGNSVAMLNLGYCYENGKGTDVNLKKAFEVYEKGANLGYCHAMCNVGNCYKYGWGVTKNLNKAREWFTKSAAQGFTGAQTSLDELNAQ